MFSGSRISGSVGLLLYFFNPACQFRTIVSDGAFPVAAGAGDEEPLAVVAHGVAALKRRNDGDKYRYQRFRQTRLKGLLPRRLPSGVVLAFSDVTEGPHH